MASKVRIRLNSSGVRQLLKSSEMQSIVKEHAQNIANASGGASKGYNVESHVNPNRAVSTAYTGSYEAMRDNAENNTLLRNVK